MDILKRQHTIISYLITYASRAREVVNRAAINADMFPDPDCRATFLALLADAAEDDTLLLELAQKTLPALKDPDSMTSILALSANSAALEYEVMEFVKNAILRQQHEDMRDAEIRSAKLPPEVLLERQKEIIASTEAKIAALNAAFQTFHDAAGKQNAAEDDEFPATDPALLDMPGFVNELTEYSMRAAPRPNKVLSFTGALAILAHLAGRKFIGPRDARPNLYLIALASSGVGKDFPQRLNRTIAQIERMDMSILSSIASGQGLEDALQRSPTLLCQIDEVDTMLEMMKDAKGSKQANESLWQMLLSLFSKSGSAHSTRTKASDASAVIYQPSVSLYASAIPERFYKSLSERACTNGFLGRCLIFEAGRRGDANFKSGETSNPMPFNLRRSCDDLANLGRRSNDNYPLELRDLIQVPYAEGAQDEAMKVEDEAAALYAKSEKQHDEMGLSIWNRSSELVGKLALLYAISEGIMSPNKMEITPKAVKWAWKLVKSCQLRMVSMVEEYSAVDEMDDKLRKVERIIRQAGKRGISRRELGRKTHLLSDVLDKIEDTLLDRGIITVNSLPNPKTGRASKHYIIVRGK